MITGGARSGKSAYAEQLAKEGFGGVTYVATAEGLDEEMAARIAAHRAKRPETWHTLEIPTGVGRALLKEAPQSELIVLDCLTLLVTNLLSLAFPNPDETDEKLASALVDEEIDLLLTAIHSCPADWIIVTNEVGMGLVPAYPLGRVFRDLLGRANQRIAAEADEVILMVAGLPWRLKPA